LKVINGTYYHTEDIQAVVDAVMQWVASVVTHRASLPDEILIGYAYWEKIYWSCDVGYPMRMHLRHRGCYTQTDLEQLSSALDADTSIPSTQFREVVERLANGISSYSQRHAWAKVKSESGMVDAIVETMRESTKSEPRIRIRPTCPRAERLQAQLRNQRGVVDYRESRVKYHQSRKIHHQQEADWHDKAETRDRARLSANKNKLDELMQNIAALNNDTQQEGRDE
jgi:hypothetical protein